MFQPRTILAAVLLALVGVCTNVRVTAAAADTTPKTAARHKLDLNSASQEELMELPGVGEVTAKKIIANRPYKSTQDLAKAGLSEKLIDRISGMVMVKSRATARTPQPASADGRRAPSTAAPSADGRHPRSESRGDASAASKKIDLNTATQEQLESLPGVGPVYAKRIVENRPYSDVSDLSMAGVPTSVVDKISGLVTVSHTRRAPAATTPSRSPQPTATEPAQRTTRTPRTEAPPSRVESPSHTTTAPTARTAPSDNASNDAAQAASNNEVWLNTDSNIYHKAGSRWYGKTKSGKFVTEDEAIRLGAHAAENE